jgi:spermidine synthase
MIDITVEDPYYLSMFTKEFFTDIYKHLKNPGVLFFNSYQEFLHTGADVFNHTICIQNPSYEKSFFFFTNFALPKEKDALFYEAFPLRQPGRIYTNNKVYRVSPATQAVKESCLL